MTFTGNRKFPRRLRLAVLAAGAVALLLPSAVTLLAEDKAPAKPAATTKAATAPVKSKEAKKAEDIQRVLAFFKETQPDVYENAMKLRETDPAKFEDAVLPAISTVNYLEEIRDKNPELYKLKIENYHLTFHIGQLRKELTRPDLAASEHDRLIQKLRDRVTRQFEVGQQLRQQDIAGIEERVKRLQAQLEEREKNRDTIIKQQMDRLAPPTASTAKKP